MRLTLVSSTSGPGGAERVMTLLANSWARRERGLDLPLWTLVSFELWCRMFLDRQPTPPVGAREGAAAAVVAARRG